MLIDELMTYLFDGQPHLLAGPMAGWLASSRRFTAFVTEARTKIRKKLRTTQETESLLDLQLELETAHLLLQERPLSIVYEPQLGGPLRAPDFAVTFTTSALFMLEVTRVRTLQGAAHPQVGKQLADMVCSKLGQLLPQRINILLAGVQAPGLDEGSLRAAMLDLQQRAERNDPGVVQRHGFRDRADFFNHYQRLSEVLVRGPAGEPVIGWVNPQAKYPLPARVRTALYKSQMSKWANWQGGSR
ncbi:MAG TPA: hypothetical protein VGJ22_13030 [Anaerolineales bacterium]|jgi:hypothetical protein